jgi:hypothetical protein
MRKLMLLRAALCALGFVVLAAPAEATSARTWVSSSGSNSGTCPITAPCATFAYAITQTRPCTHLWTPREMQAVF